VSRPGRLVIVVSVSSALRAVPPPSARDTALGDVGAPSSALEREHEHPAPVVFDTADPSTGLRVLHFTGRSDTVVWN
jgi:hypothetical protein